MAKHRQKKQPKAERLDVTPERAGLNEIVSVGMARRVKPVIDTLYEAKEPRLTREEWEALTYYRDQASLADRSPVRSCIDFAPRGTHGPGIAILSAKYETERLEAAMGSHTPIVRAIAVDDISPSQLCIMLSGGRDEGGTIKPRSRKCIANVVGVLKEAAALIGTT